MDPPFRVEAEVFVRRMGAGKAGALLLSARGQDDVLVECVVKLDAQLTMPPAEHLREWLATALAWRLGIRTPRALEVVITQAFAESIADEAVRRLALRSLRPAFGSELVTGGLTPPTPEVSLSVDLRLAAMELVGFDVFIHNADRRRENPNVLVGRRDVLAFDHGDAFGFLLHVFGAPDPATDPMLEVVRRHVFGASFGPRSGVSLDRLRDAIAGLEDEFLAEVVRLTPVAWTQGFAAGNLERAVEVLRQRRDAVEKWLPQVEACLLR